VLSLEKTAVRLFGPGGRLPGSSTTVMLHLDDNRIAQGAVVGGMERFSVSRRFPHGGEDRFVSTSVV
jgi:hypothetical protein